MAPSLTSVHDVNWNDEYVEGASKLFGPTLSKKRTRIKWSEIVNLGETSTQYWYLESVDGRKIYWSYLYMGHAVFAEAIERNCPGISFPR